jgi:hypothetical protein
MITAGASSLELRFSVSIDGGELDYSSVQSVSISLQENMHNIASLEVAGIPPDYLVNYLNLPIVITVKVGAYGSYTFYGYIYNLIPVSKNKDGLVNNSPFQTTTVNCFGATYTMRGKKTRSWEHYTLPQIARELANKYGFTVSVPNDPFVFSRWVQSEKTDWEVLVGASDYLGYRVCSDGTHIDIWDPYASLSHKGFRNLYAMSGNRGNIKARPGQVLNFTSQVSNALKTSDTLYSLVDSSIITNTYNESSGMGATVQSIFLDEVSENAVSVDMAQAALKGKNRNKFPISASVTVVGDPSIVPGMVVDLQKYDSGIDGLWLVKAARHEMFRGSAVSYLELVRDTFTSNNTYPTVIAPPTPVLPDPVLKNKRWNAQTEQVYVYA